MFSPKFYFLNLKEEYYIYKGIFSNIVYNREKQKQHTCPTMNDT